MTDFIFLGSRITADGDCSHEIKRRLLLGRNSRREFQKNTYFCFINFPKAFSCVDHNKLWAGRVGETGVNIISDSGKNHENKQRMSPRAANRVGVCACKCL